MDGLAMAREILDATDGFLPRTIADASAADRGELALASLAKARRLLSGMVELKGQPDLTGIFARVAFETWANAMYLLLGGEDALEVLANNDLYERRRMAKRLVVQLEALEEGDAGNPVILEQSRAVVAEPFDESAPRCDLAEMVIRVRKALVAGGNPNSAFAEQGYALLYGIESYTAAHGGIGAAKQYIDPAPDRAERVIAGPWEFEGEELRLALCAAMVASLADHVGRRLDIQRPELNAWAERWMQRPGSE